MMEDDGYIYQYIIQHALAAKKQSIAIRLLNDIKWINCKVKACRGIKALLCDYEMCQQQLNSLVSYSPL